MIRMIESKSAGHAKAYFKDALSRSDYYTNEQELIGTWDGKLAGRLGLTGSINQKDFFALCENKIPSSGEHLTPRTKENRRVGYDINFHCPKSVSVLHVLSKDDHILNAFRDSVTETMKHLEADVKTRVRKSGQNSERETGELIYAHFVHQTARPVEGFAPDPHLHSHCFTFNATWDKTEEQFKAGEFGGIKKDMPYYQAYFHKTLSDKLVELGYQIKITDKAFEIDGVPKRVIDLFSKRTDEIGRIAKEKGITDAKQLDELGARTRSKKEKGISMEELKNVWREQIKTLQKEEGEGETIVRFHPTKEASKEAAGVCIDHALLHCFERASVMNDRRILQEAFRYGLGNISVNTENIEHAFKEDARIIHLNENGKTVCTTEEVLKEEERMVILAKERQGKAVPLYSEAPQTVLKGQQGDAIVHVLTNSDYVTIIRGVAGSGKTTLLKELTQKIEAVQKNVGVVAPFASNSRGVLREEGFEKADTVAKQLVDKAMQQDIKNGVLIVDEAGLLGTKDTVALLQLVKKENARIVFVGDTRQHASVVRGDALRVLNTVAQIPVAEVSKIFRQQDEAYKSAVEDLSKGNVSEAFAKLDDMGSIVSLEALKAQKFLVDQFMVGLHEKKECLVVCPTHAQGDAITKEIRERMRSENLLGKKEIDVLRYINLQFTEAKKKDLRNYEEGQFVKFNQNFKGIRRGSIWKIATDGSGISIVNAKGEKKTLPAYGHEHFEINKVDEIKVSKNDILRVTSNSFDHDKKRLDNGTVLKVLSVSKKGEMKLENPTSKSIYTLQKDFGFITHAHCVTSQFSQGKTVDKIFVWQPAGTFAATDAKQFYVTISRGKETALVCTDDKEGLLKHVQELGNRTSAIELATEAQRRNKSKIQNWEVSQPKILNKQNDDYAPEI
ncbi:MobF family relaxase [Ferruginibacter albus]|uniref:MobF family relaxase n=1 Tax=Ferruginibacter albus TaxID=2875540 RepID=UPI001CC7ED57|nr:MobF family relaxase [Ferruginibacter albus]UAY53185.1 relaxase domain-containing protein [Ferruginibacter albus]